MTLHESIEKYNKLSFTHDYIFGFWFKENIYMYETTGDNLENLLTIRHASQKRGGKPLLRFMPSTDMKYKMLRTAKVLCTKAEFDELTENSQYNRGEIFEMLVAKYFGQTWKKDYVPFTEAGDIVVNGKPIQLKYERATFAKLHRLAELG